METVTGDETPKTEKTEQEIRALLDNVIERIVNTCTRLSVCAYTTDDSVEDVEHKLRETKVCSRFIGKRDLKMPFLALSLRGVISEKVQRVTS